MILFCFPIFVQKWHRNSLISKNAKQNKDIILFFKKSKTKQQKGYSPLQKLKIETHSRSRFIMYLKWNKENNFRTNQVSLVSMKNTYPIHTTQNSSLINCLTQLLSPPGWSQERGVPFNAFCSTLTWWQWTWSLPRCPADAWRGTIVSGLHPFWWRVCYQQGLPRLVFTSW